MKKVIHIITSFDLGGAEKVAINLSKSKNNNFEFHLVEVCRTKSEYRYNLLNELKKKNIKYHESNISNRKLSILIFPFQFFKLYLKLKPAIIHTHTEIPDLSFFLFYILTYPLKLNYKLFRTIHNTQLWNSWGMLGNIVEKVFIKKKSNIAISQSVKSMYESKYKDENIPLIYNGIDEVEQRKFPYLIEGKINILFAGRLSYQKGINELVTVIKELYSNNSLFFHIIGNGSEKEFIIKELSNQNNFRMYEKFYNLSTYIGSFDFLFMPSNFEGLPLISIESSFAKTPVIINNIPGLKDTLPSDWPLKVNENDINGYISIFRNLPNNNYYNIISRNAYNFVRERFSISGMQSKVEKIYLQLN